MLLPLWVLVSRVQTRASVKETLHMHTASISGPTTLFHATDLLELHHTIW